MSAPEIVVHIITTIMKAKSTKGVFEAIKAGSFSYVFHPDFLTAVNADHIEEVKKLYGTSLAFDEVVPVSEEVKVEEVTEVTE